MSGSNQTRPVVFNGNNLFFDLIDVDATEIIQKNPKFQDLFDASGITEFDAIADLLVNVGNFDNFFLVGINQQDMEDNSSNNLYYALEGSAWNNGYSVAFGDAVVRPEYAVNKNVPDEKQEVKRDFIRHLLKEVTGTLYLNTLFRNKGELISAVSTLDPGFNTAINTSLSTMGGSISSPKTNLDLSDNPVRILLNGILADRDDNLNSSRRELLLQHFDTQLNEKHEEAKTKAFYVNGTSNIGASSGTSGYFYPLYTDASHADLADGYHVHTFSDVFLNIKFYMPNNNSNHGVAEGSQDLTDLEDYANTYSTYVNIPLIEGDRLGVRVTYKPKDNSFMGRTVTERSYKIYLQMRNLGEQPLGQLYPLDGTAQQAYISNATVTIFDIAGNVIGTTTTDETGKFNYEFTSNPGVVKLDISGGVNTATGNPNTMNMKWVGDAEDAEKDANVSVATTIVTSMFEAAVESGDTVDITDTTSLLDSINVAKTKMAIAFDIPVDSIDGDYLETKDTGAAAANIKLKSFINLISDSADGGAESVISSVASLVDTVDTTNVDASGGSKINILDAADTITLVSNDISLNQLKQNAQTVVSFVDSLAGSSESEQIQMLETVNYAVEQSIQASVDDASGGGGGGGASSLVLNTETFTASVNDASNVVVMSNLFPTPPPPNFRTAMIHAIANNRGQRVNSYFNDIRPVIRTSNIGGDSALLISLYDDESNTFSKRYIWNDRYVQDELWNGYVNTLERVPPSNARVLALDSEVEVNCNWASIHPLIKDRGRYLLVRELYNNVNNAESNMNQANVSPTGGNIVVLFTTIDITTYGVKVINRYVHPMSKAFAPDHRGYGINRGNQLRKVNQNIYLLSRSEHKEKTGHSYHAFFFINDEGVNIQHLRDYGKYELNVNTNQLTNKGSNYNETKSSWQSAASDDNIVEFNNGGYYLNIGISEGLAGIKLKDSKGVLPDLTDGANWNYETGAHSPMSSLGIRIFRAKWNYDDELFEFRNLTHLTWDYKHEILAMHGTDISQNPLAPTGWGRPAVRKTGANAISSNDYYGGIEIPISCRITAEDYGITGNLIADISTRNSGPSDQTREFYNSSTSYIGAYMKNAVMRKLTENTFILGIPFCFLQIIKINITSKNNYELIKGPKQFLDIVATLPERGHFKSFDVLTLSNNSFAVVGQRVRPDYSHPHLYNVSKHQTGSESRGRTSMINCITTYKYDETNDKIVELANMIIPYVDTSTLYNNTTTLGVDYKLHRGTIKDGWANVVYTYTSDTGGQFRHEFDFKRCYCTFKIKADASEIKMGITGPSRKTTTTAGYYNRGNTFGNGAIMVAFDRWDRCGYNGEIFIDIPRGKKNKIVLDISNERMYPPRGLETTILGRVMANKGLYYNKIYDTSYAGIDIGIVDNRKGIQSTNPGDIKSSRYNQGYMGTLIFNNTKSIDLSYNPSNTSLHGIGNYVVNAGSGPSFKDNLAYKDYEGGAPEPANGDVNMLGWGWSVFDFYDDDNDDILWNEVWNGYTKYSELKQKLSSQALAYLVDIKPSAGWHSLYNNNSLNSLSGNSPISNNVNDRYRYRTGKSSLSFWESRYYVGVSNKEYGIETNEVTLEGTGGLKGRTSQLLPNRMWVEIKLPDAIHPSKIKIWPGNSHWYHFPKHFEIYACNSSNNDGLGAEELFHEFNEPVTYEHGINPHKREGSWGTTIFSYKVGDEYNYWQQAEDWFQTEISNNNLQDSGGGTGGFPFNSNIPGNPDISFTCLTLDPSSVGWQLPADSVETFNTFRFHVIIDPNDLPLANSIVNYIKIGGIRYYGYTEVDSTTTNKKEIVSTKQEWKDNKSYKLPLVHLPRPKYPTYYTFAYKTNEPKTLLEPRGTLRNKTSEDLSITSRFHANAKHLGEEHHPSYVSSSITEPNNLDIIQKSPRWDGDTEGRNNSTMKWDPLDESSFRYNIPDDLSGAVYIKGTGLTEPLVTHGLLSRKQITAGRYDDEWTGSDTHGIQLYVPRGSLYEIELFVIYPVWDGGGRYDNYDANSLVHVGRYRHPYEELGYGAKDLYDPDRNVDLLIDAGFTFVDDQMTNSYAKGTGFISSQSGFTTYRTYKKVLTYKDLPVPFPKYNFNYQSPKWNLVNPGKLRTYNYEIDPSYLLDVYGTGNDYRDTFTKMPPHIYVPEMVKIPGEITFASKLDISLNLNNTITTPSYSWDFRGFANEYDEINSLKLTKQNTTEDSTGLSLNTTNSIVKLSKIELNNVFSFETYVKPNSLTYGDKLFDLGFSKLPGLVLHYNMDMDENNNLIESTNSLFNARNYVSSNRPSFLTPAGTSYYDVTNPNLTRPNNQKYDEEYGNYIEFNGYDSGSSGQSYRFQNREAAVFAIPAEFSDSINNVNVWTVSFLIRIRESGIQHEKNIFGCLKPPSTNEWYKPGDDEETVFNLRLTKVNNEECFNIQDGKGASPPHNMEKNKWYTVSVMYTGSRILLYINDTLLKNWSDGGTYSKPPRLYQTSKILPQKQSKLPYDWMNNIRAGIVIGAGGVGNTAGANFDMASFSIFNRLCNPEEFLYIHKLKKMRGNTNPIDNISLSIGDLKTGNTKNDLILKLKNREKENEIIFENALDNTDTEIVGNIDTSNNQIEVFVNNTSLGIKQSFIPKQTVPSENMLLREISGNIVDNVVFYTDCKRDSNDYLIDYSNYNSKIKAYGSNISYGTDNLHNDYVSVDGQNHKCYISFEESNYSSSIVNNKWSISWLMRRVTGGANLAEMWLSTLGEHGINQEDVSGSLASKPGFSISHYQSTSALHHLFTDKATLEKEDSTNPGSRYPEYGGITTSNIDITTENTWQTISLVSTGDAIEFYQDNTLVGFFQISYKFLDHNFNLTFGVVNPKYLIYNDSDTNYTPSAHWFLHADIASIVILNDVYSSQELIDLHSTLASHTPSRIPYSLSASRTLTGGTDVENISSDLLKWSNPFDIRISFINTDMATADQMLFEFGDSTGSDNYMNLIMDNSKFVFNASFQDGRTGVSINETTTIPFVQDQVYKLLIRNEDGSITISACVDSSFVSWDDLHENNVLYTNQIPWTLDYNLNSANIISYAVGGIKFGNSSGGANPFIGTIDTFNILEGVTKYVKHSIQAIKRDENFIGRASDADTNKYDGKIKSLRFWNGSVLDSTNIQDLYYNINNTNIFSSNENSLATISATNTFIGTINTSLPKYQIRNLTSFNNPYNVQFKSGNVEFWNGVMLPPRDMLLRFRASTNRFAKIQCYIHKSDVTGPITWNDVNFRSDSSNKQFSIRKRLGAKQVVDGVTQSNTIYSCDEESIFSLSHWDFEKNNPELHKVAALQIHDHHEFYGSHYGDNNNQVEYNDKGRIFDERCNAYTFKGNKLYSILVLVQHYGPGDDFTGKVDVWWDEKTYNWFDEDRGWRGVNDPKRREFPSWFGTDAYSVSDGTTLEQQEILDNQVIEKYYVQGTDSAGYGYYYPLYTNINHEDLSGGYHEHKFSDVFTDVIFYMPNTGGNHAMGLSDGTEDLTGLLDYTNVYSVNYPGNSNNSNLSSGSGGGSSGGDSSGGDSSGGDSSGGDSSGDTYSYGGY